MNNAFKNYFDTFLDIKDSVIFLIDFNWDRKGLGFNFNISFKKVVTIIMEYHRYFELLIKDLLGRINPYLMVRLEGSVKNLIKDHFNDISYIEEKSHTELRTVEYGEAKDRLKLLIKYLKKNEPDNKFIKYDFLLHADSGLNELTRWRNRLSHNGKNIPNIIAIDYLISQKIIPLVSKVLNIEKENTDRDYKPSFFKTNSGINIIGKILEIKFHQNDLKKTNNKVAANEIAAKFIKLYHLKALGRASINFNKILNININVYHEYHKLNSDLEIKFAKNQKKEANYLRTSNCICCKNETLVSYREVVDDFILEKQIELIWAKCFVCDYGISNKLGNPKDSGITGIDLFKKKEVE